MLTHQQREIELHRRLAGKYDVRYGFGYSRIFQDYWNRVIIDELPDGKVALDIGCGTGVLLDELVKKCDFAVGLDISIEMLRRDTRQDKNFKGTTVGDGMSLPYKSGSFEAVACRGSLHHMPSLTSVLCEIHRVLKDKGALVLSEPSNDSLVVRLARKIMYKRSNKFDEADVAFLEGQLKRTLEECGFRVKKAKRFGFTAYALAGFPDHLPL